MSVPTPTPIIDVSDNTEIENFNCANLEFNELPIGGSYMLYPTYKSKKILVKTPNIKLIQNLIFFNNPVLYISENNMTHGLTNFIKLLNTIDKHIVDNKHTILSKHHKINKNKIDHMVQCPTVQDANKQLNATTNIDGNDDKRVKIYLKLLLDKESKFKIFYENSDNYTVYTADNIKKLLTMHKRVKFLLSINKLWFNPNKFGLSIRIMQLELDNHKIFSYKKLSEGNASNMLIDNNMLNKRYEKRIILDKSKKEYVQNPFNNSDKFVSTVSVCL